MARSNESTILPSREASLSAKPPGSAREQVGRRVPHMAPLALVAAVSLTNAACPETMSQTPFCDQSSAYPECEYCHKGSTNWNDYWVSAAATWGNDGGGRIVLLDIVPSSAQVRLPDSYTMVGGTLLLSTAAPPGQMMIRPDAGATVIRLATSLTCVSNTVDENVAVPIVVTVDLWTFGGSTGGDPTVIIDTL